MRPWGEPRPGGLGQRISRVAAWLSYAGALTCLFALGYTANGLGADHPVAATLAAAVVFFISAGARYRRNPCPRAQGRALLI